MKRNCVILIGMPGAGKSTVGVVLAKRLGMRFVDSDLVIQEQYGKLLHELIDECGVEGFWKLENDVNASLVMENSVIATGGSAVYGVEAMERLRQMGTVVYLALPYEEVEERLGDLNARGVTLKSGQNLRDLYAERTPLYEKYAHLTVQCHEKSLREIVQEIGEKIYINSIISGIINNWDPVGLLPGAPDDEYHTEISQVEHLLQTTKDVFELGEGIYNIFLGSFGDEVFRRSKSECITIAQSILTTRL